MQKTIYLFDEPTIGLHYEDVKKLIEIMQKLVQKGNTVLIIEHNMDGLIIEQGSANAIEQAILSLYQTPENLEYLSKNALQKSQLGSLKAYEQRLVNLL